MFHSVDMFNLSVKLVKSLDADECPEWNGAGKTNHGPKVIYLVDIILGRNRVQVRNMRIINGYFLINWS